MVDKNLKKTLLLIFVIITLSGFVFADWRFSSTDVGTNLYVGESEERGQSFLVWNNISSACISAVNKSNGDTATKMYLRTTGGGSNIANATCSGTLCSFSSCQNLALGTKYYLIKNSEGSPYNIRYSSGNVFPLTNDLFNWTGGYNSADNLAGYGIEWINLTIIYLPTEPIRINFTFLNQTPTNIAGNTLFSYSNVEINYNISLTNLNASTSFINYSVIHSSNAWIYINGSINQSGYQKKLYSSNSTIQYFKFLFGENDILPSTSNLPYTFFNTSHSVFQVKNNIFFKETFKNFSTNESISYLETMFNNTGASAKIYICNSTYSTGDPDINSNCYLIYNNDSLTFYNHSHNSFSAHNIFAIFTNTTTGKIGNLITATDNNVNIIYKGSATGTANVYYIPNISRTNAVQTSINNGATWTDATYSSDSHIHQFNGNEYFTYKACALNLSGTQFCDTTFYNDTIENFFSPPSPPTIISPTESIYNRTLLINYTNAISLNGSIIFYNITLLNNSFVQEGVIISNNSLNLTYLFDTFNFNLSAKTPYYIKVKATDNNGFTSQDISEPFNLSTNAEINFSLIGYPDILLQNYTLTMVDLTDNITYNFSVNTSFYIIPIIKNHIYNFTYDKFGYAISSQTYNSNQSTYQSFQGFVYTTNSISMYFFDETTYSVIYENVTITISGLTENIYYSANGSYYVDNLPDYTYTLKFRSGNYTLKTYIVSVANRSYQNLNVYLTREAGTTIFSITDEQTGSIIENAFVNVEKIINGSYTTTESKYSDITGRVQIVYTIGANYRFTISKTSYVTKQFTLNPILFSAYSILLTPTLSQTNTNDYDLIGLTYTPKTFINNQLNNFTFIITAPTGVLEYYNISLKFRNNISSGRGSNSYGGTIPLQINISGATYNEKVQVNYTYKAVNIAKKNFVFYYEIIGANNTGNNTFTNLITNSYGLGLFEKALLTMIVVVLVAGFSFALAGLGGALSMGLLVEGIAVYMGYLPLSSILVSVLVGLVLIVASSGGNK